MSSYNCPICKNSYNKNEHKPMILKCGDTACLFCINCYKEAFNKDTFECPKCGVFTSSLNIENKSAYPKNESNSHQNLKKGNFEIFITTPYMEKFEMIVTETMTVGQLEEKIEREKGYNQKSYQLCFKRPLIDNSRTLKDYKIIKTCTLRMISSPVGGGDDYMKEINIKFIKAQNTKNKFYISIFLKDRELHGLLKLCLLKEISSKLNNEQIKQLPDIVSYIVQILKNGYIKDSIAKEDIKRILEKMKGSNILNFSRFIDKSIDVNQIKTLLQFLNKEELENIKDIERRLLNYNEYMKLFEEDFEIRKQNSVFEFSIISLVITEREDLEIFEKGRKNCPNKVDKILYHGTQIEIIKPNGDKDEPLPSILTGFFRKSVNAHYQHGKGVYFTDVLDYCWMYGGETNRINKNRIPNIDDTFTFIGCTTYYNKAGYRKVKDYKYTPKENEINFAYANSLFDTIEDEPDKSKFYGTEYVIWDLPQICPLIGAKLKRKEYCVIWRDNNFSSKPVYNNEFDSIFKKFLKARMVYIEQYAEQNIYACETSEEALDLIKRKKYNKIILISNVGSDLGGKKFIDDARNILKNDVIALFLAYNTSHLKWIQNYKNSLFSNDPTFYEEYLQCFSEKNYDKKESLLNLKSKIENHYNAKFNFDEKFLNFPLYKCEGKYSDLIF